MVEICQDRDIQRFTRVPTPYRETEAQQFLGVQDVAWLNGTEAAFAAVDSTDEGVLAHCSLRLTGEARGDIGYLVAADARGRGVAGRCVRLLAGWGFGTLGLARIELHVHVENAPSQLVAERAGFTREGVLRHYMLLDGRRADCVLWSLLPGDG
jgi:RimJ/RimL family protein N-acetyltransferase